MYNAHKHLNLVNKDFDVIVELLVKTLTELGVPTSLIQEIGALLEPLRKDCVIDEKSIFYRIGG
jgi:hypothetical protein